MEGKGSVGKIIKTERENISLKNLTSLLINMKCVQRLLQKVAVTRVQNMEYMYIYMKLRNSSVDY